MKEVHGRQLQYVWWLLPVALKWQLDTQNQWNSELSGFAYRQKPKHFHEKKPCVLSDITCGRKKNLPCKLDIKSSYYTFYKVWTQLQNIAIPWFISLRAKSVTVKSVSELSDKLNTEESCNYVLLQGKPTNWTSGKGVSWKKKELVWKLWYVSLCPCCTPPHENHDGDLFCWGVFWVNLRSKSSR